MPAPSFRILPARAEPDLAAIAALFKAYAEALDRAEAHRDIAGELATLPGAYAPPPGELLLAVAEDGAALGCVALRPLAEPGCCEMKRFFVAPWARGLGLGRALIAEAVAVARRAGHREMRLDTLSDMVAAKALYAQAGFVPIARYHDSPFPDVTFLGLRL